ncbi:MAG TPA: tripartite tricarboxylate transporter substrate binding protein [Hyphomicrobiales bacterium]|nr:tripartite tricarboxylate transporter substrate binding protein [Hyphomicrobiales bacterium]
MTAFWKWGSRALGVAVLAAAVQAAPLAARADDYPSRDIHVICAFPAGSGADVLVRYFADKLQKEAKRTTIVENRTGANGNISAQYVARSDPDGYTIYIHAGSSTAANYSLFKRPPIDPRKDLQVVATLNKQPFMVVVPAESSYKTLGELTEAMKKKGDKANYASSNTSGTVLGQLYERATGVKAVEIHYRTAADTLNDFKSGVLDYGMMDPVFALSQAKAGRIRMLAVATDERMKAIPDVPTMKEQGVDISLPSWFAAMVPSKTPKPIVTTLNGWFNAIEKMPETAQYLAKFGGDPFITTPEEGQELLSKAVDEWAKYVEIAKLPKS